MLYFLCPRIFVVSVLRRLSGLLPSDVWHNPDAVIITGAILKTQITFYMWFLTHTIFNVCQYFVCALCHHAILKTDVIKYYFMSIGSLVSIWALFCRRELALQALPCLPSFGELHLVQGQTASHLPLQWDGFSRCNWRVKRPWTSCKVASLRGLVWKGRLRRRDLVCFQL